MRFIKTLFIFFTLLLAGSSMVLAQVADTAVKEVRSSTNMLSVLMIIISLVLAFVIYSMGQVLLTLTRQVMDKNKTAINILPAVFIIGFMLLSVVSTAQDIGVDAVVKVLPNYGGLDASGFWVMVFVVGIETIAVLVMLFFIKRIQQELIPAKIKVPSEAFSQWWARVNNKFFTKAVAVEKEADILLDHDYDGIRELDNALPPWWKYGFIITIFFALIYLVHFHVLGSGNNPTQEYNSEMLRAAAQQQAYEAKNKDKVDENNILLADAVGISAGKEIFQQVCFACHGRLGEGGAGPNLTDDYWLHEGSLNDIYHSIKTGYPDKGMQAWEKQFNPKQMSNIASYIKKISGTKPANGKAPQGDIFTAAPVTDSTLDIKDSLQKK